MSATVENAEAVAALTADATEHLTDALRAIREAVVFAGDDYEHNADKLQHVLGALHLLTGTVAGEQYVWRDYALARRRHAAVGVTGEAEK